MRVPGSTYRIQLHAAFTFDDAAELVPYLRRLGVTDLYLSPVSAAASGSAHGYDVVDPTRIDEERGGREAFERLARRARTAGMGILLDIVPNHMSATAENAWWWDVLEHGAASSHADVFDIDWAAGSGRLTLPVLGDHYADVLERGELTLARDGRGIVVAYFDERFPLDPATLVDLFGTWLASPAGRLAPSAARELGALQALAADVPARTTTGRRASARRAAGAAALRERLDAACARAAVRRAIDANLEATGGPDRIDALDALLEAQAYRLAYWRSGTDAMTYRRFFDITSLVGVRVEDPGVFARVHDLVLRLAADGHVTGVRIDHIDGLRDPVGYLERLRLALPGSARYVVVEKILERHEMLPDDWPAEGTTGYEFADHVAPAFAHPEGAARVDAVGARFCGTDASFDEIVAAKKRLVLATLFAGEVDALVTRLASIARGPRRGRDLSQAALRDALVEITVALDVYRTYVRAPSVDRRDRDRIRRAAATARTRVDDAAAVDLVEALLLFDLDGGADHLDFVMRWQQLSGPAMAKGFEDTALYASPRFVSRNEVGGDPSVPALSPDDVHTHLRRVARRWPASLNATSTHDSKRGEDVRARIDVLSEVPDRWEELLHRWRDRHARLKADVAGSPAPAPADELLLYQTIVGAWPLDRAARRGFTRRVCEYAVKASREAKERTSWRDPDADYERALVRFVRAVLSPSNTSLHEELQDLLETVAFHGAVNSLAQLVTKLAAPGVPDTYRGAELWTLTLVDPDNRRPVDFDRRRAVLDGLDRATARRGAARAAADAWASWRDGSVKLLVTACGLRLRADLPELFARGDYRQVAARGRSAEHVFAFARRRGRDHVVAVVPRLTVSLAGAGTSPTGRKVWGDTDLELPRGPRVWTNALTGEEIEATDEHGTTRVAQALSVLPVALLHGRKEAS